MTPPAGLFANDRDGTDAPGAQRACPLLLGMGWFPDQPGGLNRYFTGLCYALGDRVRGWRAVAIGPAAAPPDSVQVAGSVDEPSALRILRYARAAIRQTSGTDLIDAHFALYALLPTLVSRLRGKPLVVHFHGPWAEESVAAGEASRLAIWVKHALERAVYRRAARLVVLSGAFKQSLVERYGVSPWKVEVVPPGVELERFVLGDRAQARAALDIDERAWVAVAVRRLVPRVGLDILLDAWAKAGTGLEDALLVIAGDGPERSTLEERANALGLGGRVRFLGRISDSQLVALYQAADVSVVPSVALEGFGLVVLEALACGTPVVASDTGGLPEALAGLDPSLIIPAGDRAALAARLQAAYRSNRSLPSRQDCRRYAETFSWDRAADRTLEIYRQAVLPADRRRLRVVILDHCARLSGAELALLDLLPALQEEVEFHVVLGEDGPMASRLTRLGVSVEVLAMSETARGLPRDRVRPGRLPLRSVVSSAMHTLRLVQRLRRLRPDLVHANSLKACLYGGAAARLAGIPVVWHIHDRIAEDYLPVPAVRLVRTLARRLPTAVLANSSATLATLPGVSGTVAANPVAIDGTIVGERCRSGPLWIGMLGRLASWKGQHVFLEAFASAFPDGTEQAVIIGSSMFAQDDAYAAALRRLAARLGLAHRVTFSGFREDVAAELSRLDILVHASVVPEPFGRVVVEGMAAGLPVIATGQGGPAEIIENEVNGLLVPPNDTAALAHALRRLADRPELRRMLRAAARHRAQDFTPDAVAATVLSTYLSVAKAPPTSAPGRWRADKIRVRTVPGGLSE
jgi:glycosyltransferase involved in cell wall biosynthesis